MASSSYESPVPPLSVSHFAPEALDSVANAAIRPGYLPRVRPAFETPYFSLTRTAFSGPKGDGSSSQLHRPSRTALIAKMVRLGDGTESRVCTQCSEYVEYLRRPCPRDNTRSQSPGTLLRLPRLPQQSRKANPILIRLCSSSRGTEWNLDSQCRQFGVRKHLAEVIEGCGLYDALIETRDDRAAAALLGFIAG